ncbi:MAG: hypothetical protein DRP65_02995 [Planctomycetota bacterium]|nr:MAG: hypothetical protein DRP65_02995 [Planctomycetota bacterium]
MQLNPCEYTVVVKDTNQFEAEYGTGANIAGAFTDEDESIDFIFPLGTTIPAGGYLLLVDEDAFNYRYSITRLINRA